MVSTYSLPGDEIKDAGLETDHYSTKTQKISHEEM
jgi:hypothetical protein